jgi:hypothetical protein
MKWKRLRNLRLRPAKPALGNGRLQTQVRRVFIVADAPAISATEIYSWCYAKRRLMHGKPLTTWDRYSVWKILRTIATPVGRARTIGRPLLWKLNDNIAARWR